jgi:hypothetical protein
MKGNAKVVAQLNVALKEELTAVNQYFLHAEMCHKWGYHKLGAFIKKSSIDPPLAKRIRARSVRTCALGASARIAAVRPKPLSPRACAV